MFTALFWIYLLNAVLIIDHEIESAYWKEWDLFKLPGKITGFVMIHIPVLALILIGSTLVYMHSTYGYVISVLLSAGGIFAFCAHMYFIRKGRSEFRLPASVILLILILFVSLIQLGLSVYCLLK